jgi:plasmid rolling circle replication initiator protein Rep
VKNFIHKRDEVQEQDQKNDFLSDYSARDAKWDYWRDRTQSFEQIYHDGDYTKLASRLNNCSSLLGFSWQTDKETGESRIKLRNAMFCRVRHCPVCQWRRSVRNVARFMSKIPDLETLYPKHRWLFLTLTVPNCKFEDLRETVAAMNKGWKRLIERKGFPATGWIKTVEVTKEQNRPGYAHPHFHCLLMVSPSYFSHGYIKQAEWLAIWRDAMRMPEIQSVDIRVIKPKGEGDSALHSAVLETLKYGVKVEDGLSDPDFLFCLTDQLRKMRFLASGGVLKDLLKDDLSNKEMITGDELTDEEPAEEEAGLFFGWQRQIRRYRKR